MSLGPQWEWGAFALEAGVQAAVLILTFLFAFWVARRQYQGDRALMLEERQHQQEQARRAAIQAARLEIYLLAQEVSSLLWIGAHNLMTEPMEGGFARTARQHVITLDQLVIRGITVAGQNPGTGIESITNSLVSILDRYKSVLDAGQPLSENARKKTVLEAQRLYKEAADLTPKVKAEQLKGDALPVLTGNT